MSGINKMLEKEIRGIISAYNNSVKGVAPKATEDATRAYGGIIRSDKGSLVENIAKQLVGLSWAVLGEDEERIVLDRKKTKIPIRDGYLDRIENPKIKSYIESNIEKYVYGLSQDINVKIDGDFVLSVECKSYAENAMLKRVLVDSWLLKQVNPDLRFVLLQLESMLGGDYSELDDVTYGSRPTHAILSYFDFDLSIITLLEGPRKVEEPIHAPEYFKPLKKKSLINAVGTFSEILKDYI